MKTKNLTKKKIPLILLKRILEFCKENEIDGNLLLKEYKKEKFLYFDFTYTLKFKANNKDYFYTHSSDNNSNFKIKELLKINN